MLPGVGAGEPVLEPVLEPALPREDEPHASNNAINALTTMAPKKSSCLFFLVLRVLESRIKLGTSSHIAYTGTREVAEGMRPALPPVVAMLTFTLTGDPGITVAGDKEHFAPMGRFAHVNVKL
jgi:hypothetical protein